MAERLQKLLSAAGICSRREGEVYLRAGRVTVNGRIARLGDKADWETDCIALDGVMVQPVAEQVYLMLNKPRGYVTTLSDDRGRPTVADLVAGCGARVYPVGRLDYYSQGLLLLTNDGGLAQRLTHPSHQIEKEYYVTVSGCLEGCVERLSALSALEDGTPIAPIGVAVTGREPGTLTLSLTLHQGLNRQIRRMCALAGLRVHRLERVREGNLRLDGLPLGVWRRLTKEEQEGIQNT